MKSARIFHKIALMIVGLLFFSSSQVCAGSATPAQSDLWQGRLAGNSLAGLSIDHSQLFAGSTGSAAAPVHYALATGSAGTAGGSEPQQRGASLERWHKYLGYGTVLMAGVTAVSHSDEDFHEGAAYVTAAGALSTLLTGYLAHGERFDTEAGLLSRDNLHIALGTLGAVLLTTAVAISDDGEEGSHSTLGVTGGVLMALGVIDIKW